MVAGRMWLWGAVALLSLAMILSACGAKTASSRFYVLSALPQPDSSEPSGATLGVLPVSMPDYLDRPQMVTRVSENEIQIDEFNRWAEPLKDNLYRVLVENLSALLQSEKVVKTVEGLGLPLPLQVKVEVVQFDGTLGGDVVLIARWFLYQQKGKEIVATNRYIRMEPTSGPDYGDMVTAGSKALTGLSHEIAGAIRRYHKDAALNHE